MQVRLLFCPATLCGDRACRRREMQVRLRFGFVPRNPLRRQYVSKVRNAWKSPKKLGTDMPSKTDRASSVSNGLPKPIEQRANKKSHKRCRNWPVAQRVTQKKGNWKRKSQCHSNKLERKFARCSPSKRQVVVQTPLEQQTYAPKSR